MGAGRCKQAEVGVLKALALWGPRLVPVKSLKRRGAVIRCLESAIVVAHHWDEPSLPRGQLESLFVNL